MQRRYFGRTHQTTTQSKSKTKIQKGKGGKGKGGKTKHQFENAQIRQLINFFFFRYPMLGGGLIGGLKAGAADYFTQIVVEQRKIDYDGTLDDSQAWNRNRTILFGLLGTTYGGFINYFLHSYLNPMLWGTSKTPMVIFKSILFDQLVHVPFVSFPLFYAFKGMVYSNGDVMEAKKYVSHYWNVSIFDDLLMCWKLWVPCHMITYGLIPRMMRVYWVNLVSATWTAVLSYKRGELAVTEPAKRQDKYFDEEELDDIEEEEEKLALQKELEKNTSDNENLAKMDG